MILTEINIYPIKSTKGISLQNARVEKRGIENDRRWMVVDEEGVFISQREAPRLALISVAIGTTHLTLSAPGAKNLSIPIKPVGTARLSVRVWDDVVTATFAGEDAASWFSEFLGLPCSVVHMPEETLRPVEPEYAQGADIVSFADGFPLLLISQPSLDDLNSRLAKPVPMNRFRPNIVVSGCGPYAEDRWNTIRIGQLAFRVVKPCSRCVTTTVDQSTGVSGKEPLATLSKYRNVNGNVHFGQNVIPESTGVIRAGDQVELIS